MRSILFSKMARKRYGIVMKNKFNIAIFTTFVFMLLSLCFSACEFGGDSADDVSENPPSYGKDGALIVGTWSCTFDGKTVSFTFGNDGGGSGSFTPQTNGLETVDIRFEFEDNVLSLVSYPVGDSKNAIKKESYEAKLEDGILYIRPLGSNAEYYKFYKS